MRTLERKLFLTISLVSLMACQPQDKALRSSSNAGDSSKTTGPAAAGNSREDSNKQMLLLMDRTAEATKLLQITLRVLNGEDLASEGGLQVLQISPLEGKADPHISVGHIQWNQMIEDESIKAVSSQKIQFHIERDPEGLIEKINFTALEDQLRVESVQKKTSKGSVTLKNAHQSIRVVKVGENLFQVNIKTLDEVNQVSGKSFAASEVSFDAAVVMNSSGGDLKPAFSQWSLQNLKLKQSRVGASTDDFDLESLGSQINLELEGSCYAMQGAFRLNSLAKKSDGKPQYYRDVNLGPLKVQISAGPNKTEASSLGCQKSLFVDVSKLM